MDGSPTFQKSIDVASDRMHARYRSEAFLGSSRTFHGSYHKLYCAAIWIAPCVRPFALSRPARGRPRRRPPLLRPGAGVRRSHVIVRGLRAARGTVWLCELRPRGQGVVETSRAMAADGLGEHVFLEAHGRLYCGR